jgi:hypothetical protein
MIRMLIPGSRDPGIGFFPSWTALDPGSAILTSKQSLIELGSRLLQGDVVYLGDQ